MRYYISNNIIESDEIRYHNNLDILYSLFNDIPEIEFDIETTGLDPHSHKLLLYQIGNKENQVVVNNKDFPITLIQDFLLSKTLIIQNAKFELKWLMKYNIYLPIGQIYDTMLAEQVSYLGYNESSNLAYLVNKYCNINLEKETRLNFTKSNIIGEREITYAAKDVEYLGIVKEKQKERINKYHLNIAVQLQNDFVYIMAYMEYVGMYINKEKWIGKHNKILNLLERKKEELIKLILEDPRLKVMYYTDLFDNTQLDLNLDSSKQMIPIFLKLGLDLSSDDSVSGISISEKTLGKYKHEPIVKSYLKYKKLKKDITTYGEKFLKNINPNSGRLHTDYIQLLNTGRHSSSKPNLQNLPRDPYTRSCFEGENGNFIIGADYSD